MVTIPSTSTWKPIDRTVFDSFRLTTEFREVPREHWPAWASGSTNFIRIGVRATPIESQMHATLPSVGVFAALLTERIDPKDYPKVYNCNIHLIAESTDGMLYQSGPIIPTEPAHHSSSPSTWFNSLGSPTRA